MDLYRGLYGGPEGGVSASGLVAPHYIHMYIPYIYIYVYMHMYICIYIYMYIYTGGIRTVYVYGYEQKLAGLGFRQLRG